MISVMHEEQLIDFVRMRAILNGMIPPPPTKGQQFQQTGRFL